MDSINHTIIEGFNNFEIINFIGTTSQKSKFEN